MISEDTSGNRAIITLINFILYFHLTKFSRVFLKSLHNLWKRWVSGKIRAYLITITNIILQYRQIPTPFESLKIMFPCSNIVEFLMKSKQKGESFLLPGGLQLLSADFEKSLFNEEFLCNVRIYTISHHYRRISYVFLCCSLNTT